MEEILYGTDAPTARVETSALLFCVLMQRPGVVSARSEVVVWAGFMDDESARAAYRRHLLKSGFDVRDEDSITVSRIP